jgi:uncharacterized protein (TIGR02285 family)
MSSLMRSEQLFCTIDLLKNPKREQYMAFSQPVFYLMPPVLVTRKNESEVQRIVEEGELSLDTILQSSLRLGIRSHRHYTGSISRFINQYEEKTGVYHSRNDQVLIDMLTGKRLDILFLNAAELPFFDKNKELVGYPIKAENYIPVPISCTNTLLGRRIIEDFNQAIASHSLTTLSAPYKAFLPASLQSRYDNAVTALSGR